MHFIVTSRERLDIEGEWLFELSGLRYPDGKSPELDYAKYSAIQFFLYSAKQVRSSFKVSEADYPAIAHICEMVDGMPLAIELAAAWVRVISCAEISVEIEHGLEILSTTRQDVLDRHRSLRVVFDNSWQLLTAEEQRAFRSLSVFRGVFERGDAERVAGVGLTLLSTLVDKTLVSWDHKCRYNMHELIGDYARQKLRESGDENAIYARLTETILHYAESAEQELRGPQQSIWLDRLESQRNNVRAAFDWILLSGCDQTLEEGLRIVSAMAGFWWLRGMSEGRDWLASLLQHPRAAKHTVARARALTLAGDLAIEQEGNFALARLFYEESMLISKELGDRQGIASTLLGQGVIAYTGGDVAGAQSLTEQSLEIWQTLEESWGVAWATHRLGDLAFERGDMEPARLLFNECLVIRREIGDKSGIAWLFQRLGEIARYEGFYEQAQALYDEALRMHKELASNGGVTATITSMGYLALNQGNLRQARSLFKEGISQNLGNQIMNALCLIGLAGAVIDPVNAVRWLGAADSIFIQSSSFIDRIDHDRILTAVHAQLDEPTFAIAWEAGKSMLLDQAIEIAIQDEHTRESC